MKKLKLFNKLYPITSFETAWKVQARSFYAKTLPISPYKSSTYCFTSHGFRPQTNLYLTIFHLRIRTVIGEKNYKSQSNYTRMKLKTAVSTTPSSSVTKIKEKKNFGFLRLTERRVHGSVNFPFLSRYRNMTTIKNRTNIRGKLRAVRLFNKRDYPRYSLGERDLISGTKAIGIDTKHANGEYEMLINCPSYIMYVINVIRRRCFAFMHAIPLTMIYNMVIMLTRISVFFMLGLSHSERQRIWHCEQKVNSILFILTPRSVHGVGGDSIPLYYGIGSGLRVSAPNKSWNRDPYSPFGPVHYGIGTPHTSLLLHRGKGPCPVWSLCIKT